MYNPHGIKLLTTLRVGISDLQEHKFRHNFQHSLDPFFNCGRHIETTISFFLRCSNYSNKRKTIFEKKNNINCSLLNKNDSNILETLPFGSNSLNNEENGWIIQSTIEYLIATERLIFPLLWIHLSNSPLFLKSLIDSGSPYVILFSCLIVQYIDTYIYIYIYIYTYIYMYYIYIYLYIYMYI